MYQINTENNELIEINPRGFKELGFKERENLQEWIAKTPSALGEELLIIQKEFDGFDDTRERLDLLALDKKGNLVLIENKLDDSGKDVVWQSLKYASYCSSLKKANIVQMYQEYLNKEGRQADATENICEFLEKEDINDIILNSGTNQRIKLVAANFRREVTSTVLWLLNYGLQIECFKITAYSKGIDTLLINFDQIIPTPEAADFMIGINEKDKEEKQVERSRSVAETLRYEFWNLTLDELSRRKISLFDKVSASRDHWLSIGFGISGISLAMIFSKFEARIDLYISRSDKETNKQIFDIFAENKHEIEQSFGSELTWQRLDDKKACRIKCFKKFDGYNKENWEEMIDWLATHLTKMNDALRPISVKINRKLRG
jgi:hypothetical protein